LVGEAALVVTLLLLLAPTGDFNDFAGTSKLKEKPINLWNTPVFFYCSFMQQTNTKTKGNVTVL
jgi:hypothetical protein